MPEWATKDPNEDEWWMSGSDLRSHSRAQGPRQSWFDEFDAPGLTPRDVAPLRAIAASLLSGGSTGLPAPRHTHAGRSPGAPGSPAAWTSPPPPVASTPTALALPATSLDVILRCPDSTRFCTGATGRGPRRARVEAGSDRTLAPRAADLIASRYHPPLAPGLGLVATQAPYAAATVSW